MSGLLYLSQCAPSPSPPDMNPFKVIHNIASTILTVAFLGWFGFSCVKFGWDAHANPWLRPIVTTMLDLDIKKE